ncbi:MAG: hypothetical protein ACQKBU_12565, partial [Verrucomicrobiales bacterium]
GGLHRGAIMQYARLYKEQPARPLHTQHVPGVKAENHPLIVSQAVLHHTPAFGPDYGGAE